MGMIEADKGLIFELLANGKIKISRPLTKVELSKTSVALTNNLLHDEVTIVNYSRLKNVKMTSQNKVGNPSLSGNKILFNWDYQNDTNKVTISADNVDSAVINVTSSLLIELDTNNVKVAYPNSATVKVINFSAIQGLKLLPSDGRIVSTYNSSTGVITITPDQQAPAFGIINISATNAQNSAITVSATLRKESYEK